MTAITLRRRVDREAEQVHLSAIATRAHGSGDRVVPEEPHPYRTCFERDRDRIIHSKAFRRLKHKTQVFINPPGDHTVTRLTHTLQVAQVARGLAASMALNEPLAEAIALGHDVGHTPFGHIGEDALATFFDDGWAHSAQSVRIFDVLEPLNLCAETRDGIRSHPWKVQPPPSTAEGRCVRFADRIAYLTHDVLDAVRAGLISPTDLPEMVIAAFGAPSSSSWIGQFVQAVVEHSVRVGQVEMDPAILPVMHELRAFMFDRIYLGEAQSTHTATARRIVIDLVGYLRDHPEEMTDYADPDAPAMTQVADFVSGMTDRYALALHDRYFRPRLFDVGSLPPTHPH